MRKEIFKISKNNNFLVITRNEQEMFDIVTVKIDKKSEKIIFEESINFNTVVYETIPVCKCKNHYILKINHIALNLLLNTPSFQNIIIKVNLIDKKSKYEREERGTRVMSILNILKHIIYINDKKNKGDGYLLLKTSQFGPLSP